MRVVYWADVGGLFGGEETHLCAFGVEWRGMKGGWEKVCEVIQCIVSAGSYSGSELSQEWWGGWSSGYGEFWRRRIEHGWLSLELAF